MSNSLALYQDGYLSQIGGLFEANGLQKINLGDPDDMHGFVLSEYSRLHMHLKGAQVFAGRDQVWARTDPHATGQVVHTLFIIRHADVAGFSPSSTIYRHDAMISYEGKKADNKDKSTLETKDSIVSAKQLQNMPDFFFRPRFKGRAASSSIRNVATLLRPSLERIKQLLGSKIGLQ